MMLSALTMKPENALPSANEPLRAYCPALGQCAQRESMKITPVKRDHVNLTGNAQTTEVNRGAVPKSRCGRCLLFLPDNAPLGQSQIALAQSPARADEHE